MPRPDLRRGVLEPGGRRPVLPQPVVDLLDGDERVADHGERLLLRGVPAGGVDRDEPHVWVLEHRPRPGGEVLEAGADGDDDVGVLGDGVRRGRPRHPDRACVIGVIVDERGLAGNGLDDRDPPPLGERSERGHRSRVVHAASGDDHRLLGGGERRDRRRHVAGVGPGAADVVDLLREERRRVVVGLGLNVLRQREERRPAFGGIEHDRERLRKRTDDLLRSGDPVPVSRHRFEGITYRHRRIPEVLHLLEHGVDDAVREVVAAEEEQRESVGVGDGGGGHHVRAPRADRRGRDHDPPPPHRLGVGNGGECHRLLVVAPPHRQHVLDGLERFGERRDVPVSEDAERPGEERDLLTVDDGVLGSEPLDDGLGRGEPDGLHGSLLSLGVLPDTPSSRDRGRHRFRLRCSGHRARSTPGRSRRWRRRARASCRTQRRPRRPGSSR